MTKAEMLALPRYYKHEKMEREVALYIDGKYVARGPGSQGRAPATRGWKGLDEVVSPGRLTFELDFAGPDRRDTQCLCWMTGVRLSAAEFLAWLDGGAA